MKRTWLWGLPLAVGLGTLLISEKIFKTATHRRVKYPVPAKRMMRYAREYYRYIDWYQQIPKQTWVPFPPISPQNSDNMMFRMEFLRMN